MHKFVGVREIQQTRELTNIWILEPNVSMIRKHYDH